MGKPQTLIQSAPAPTCLRTAFLHSSTPSATSAPIIPSTPSWLRMSLLLGPVNGNRRGERHASALQIFRGSRSTDGRSTCVCSGHLTTYRSCQSAQEPCWRNNSEDQGRENASPKGICARKYPRHQRLQFPGPCIINAKEEQESASANLEGPRQRRPSGMQGDCGYFPQDMDKL